MKIMDYSMLIGVHNISLRTTKKILTSISQRTTVSAEDGDDRSNSSYGASASNATLDRFLDLDDDDSYLDGANPKGGKRVTTSLSDESFRTVRVVKSPDNADDESSKESKIGSDVILEKAIEDMYWPFHRELLSFPRLSFVSTPILTRLLPLPCRLLQGFMTYRVYVE
jgi:hypothetical protein